MKMERVLKKFIESCVLTLQQIICSQSLRVV